MNKIRIQGQGSDREIYEWNEEQQGYMFSFNMMIDEEWNDDEIEKQALKKLEEYNERQE